VAASQILMSRSRPAEAISLPSGLKAATPTEIGMPGVGEEFMAVALVQILNGAVFAGVARRRPSGLNETESISCPCPPPPPAAAGCR